MIIQIEITDEEAKILAHYLLESPEEWLRKALRGKINSRRGALAEETRQKLMSDPTVETMPATEIGLVRAAFAMPDYKNRATVEAELKAKEEQEMAARLEAEAVRK